MPLPTSDFEVAKFLTLEAKHEDLLLRFQFRPLQRVSLLRGPPRYSVPHGLPRSPGRQRRGPRLEMLPVAALQTGVLNTVR